MKKKTVQLVTLALVFCLSLANAAKDEPEAVEKDAGEAAIFKGHKLIEAVPMTSDDLEFLRTLDETVPVTMASL
jgi:hypothetical protein